MRHHVDRAHALLDLVGVGLLARRHGGEPLPDLHQVLVALVPIAEELEVLDDGADLRVVHGTT